MHLDFSDCSYFRVLNHSLFALTVPPTWRRGLMLSVSDITAPHVCRHGVQALVPWTPHDTRAFRQTETTAARSTPAALTRVHRFGYFGADRRIIVSANHDVLSSGENR